MVTHGDSTVDLHNAGVPDNQKFKYNIYKICWKGAVYFETFMFEVPEYAMQYVIIVRI
jgi:hypothetical protein